MFSTRLPGHAEINALSRAVQAVRAAGTPIVDLTESNPTQRRASVPAGSARRALARAAALCVRAAAVRPASAREAVAADYARRGVRVDPRTSC